MEKYTIIEEKYIEEIQSKITIYKHNKSNARVCTIENDDDNKVFSIGFRTPPINDCGLTHILEHSVLCGSKAFPVKDPFVELLKSSLNTFLNAMTYSDKTVYPVASQNLQDFKNLMHVYMDAVFYPQIYSHEEIFKQEGWHYHLEKKEDPITINGVVYNEMKGAFSNPFQVLYSKLEQSLFPDTAYHYESGGDPKYIPELDYETFKNFHQKFYHPSNSYIHIYGNCDMKERLEWLDKEYLSNFDSIDFDTRLQYQKPFEAPKYMTEYYPIQKGDSKKDKTMLTYNVALPSTLDQKLVMAFSILMKALFDVPGAPLKQALIDAKIGQDIESIFEDGILQPIVAVAAVNANAEDEERFIQIINEELAKFVKNGLDKDALLALINRGEFKARERSFSPRTPQGLNTCLTMYDSWLYDDSLPFLKLECLKYYSELKNDLNNGYFEALIEKYILNNTHKTFVKLVPDDTLALKKEQELAKKLEAFKNSLSDKELDDLVLATKKLKEYQSEGDSKEAVDSLPKLEIKDINLDPEEYKLEVINGYPKVLLSDYSTNSIVYVRGYFDISKLNFHDLKYASLFAALFTQMSTKKHTYKEINQMIQNDFGTMSLDLDCQKHYLTKEAKVYLKTGFSCLANNVEKGYDLLFELLEDTLFQDEKRLYECLCEMKTNFDYSLSSRGNQVALRRAASYIDLSSFQSDLTCGIAFSDFITEIVTNFEEKKALVISKLSSIYKMLFSQRNMVVGFTGTKEEFESAKPIIEKYYNKLQESIDYIEATPFAARIKNEAFTAPIDVNYVARIGKFESAFHGGLYVLQNAMSLDYLWMQVRVHGGAYGCNMVINPSGSIGFTSYRDPNIRKTNDVYQNATEFVKNFNPTDEQFIKFKIGAIGNLQSVLHNSNKAETARINYLLGISYERRKQIRKEVLSVTKEEVKSFSSIFEEVLKGYQIACIGNQSKIEEAKDMFSDIRPLTK